jgi:hypothetical protein
LRAHCCDRKIFSKFALRQFATQLAITGQGTFPDQNFLETRIGDFPLLEKVDMLKEAA